MLPSLTIQRKILIGLVLPAVCLVALTGYSYSNLTLIENRIRVLSEIDQAELAVMELRRLGKLYLFYETKKDHASALAAGEAALAKLNRVKENLLFSQSREMVDSLSNRVEAYVESIRRVRAAFGESDEHILALKSDAHMQSMELEERGMHLSSAVLDRIGYISENLRFQLLAAAFGVGALFAMLGYFVTVHVLRPLKVIEGTTRQIGEGNFTPVPLRGTRDEIRDLQEAFNTMVFELQSRQDQLVQSQKLSSIGTLSAGIAHQVNNPLNNISLSAQMMRRTAQQPDSPGFQKALANIEKETERARDIVRGLLDFARQSEFSPRLIRLKTVVATAVRFASTQLAPGVSISVDIPEDCRLYLDPQRMSEALLNIIMNGIQAIGAGPGEVRIRMAEETPKSGVTLIVEDTGAGIAPEDLPHIFDPFFTRKEVGKGTGLGLSIGYGIIEECKGKVWVKSEPGKGARFYINLPAPEPGGRNGNGEDASS